MLTSAVAPYVTFKEEAHGMVCLSETRWGLNFLTSLHNHHSKGKGAKSEACKEKYEAELKFSKA